MIKIIPNVLSSQECYTLLRELDPIDLTIDVNYYSQDTNRIKKYPFGIKYIRDNQIDNKTGYAVYPLVENLLQRIEPVGELVSCTIVYYPSGSKNAQHSDNSKITIVNNEMVVEKINNWEYTGILFLNDDFDGGHLVYPDQGCDIKPTIGTMVIAPAGIDYTHYVSEVVNGDRFVLVYRFI